MSEFESDFGQSEADLVDRWAFEDPTLFNNGEELVAGLCSDMLYGYDELEEEGAGLCSDMLYGYDEREGEDTGLCSDMLYEYNERDDLEESFVDFDDYDQTLHQCFDYGYREPSTNRSSKQVVTQTKQSSKQVATQTKRSSKQVATQTEHDALDVTCQVCFESVFDRNRIVMTTQCGHMFCKTCLDQVLNFKKECPLCRSTIRRVFRLYF